MRSRQSDTSSHSLLRRLAPLLPVLLLCAMFAQESASAQQSFSHYGRHFLIPFPDTTRDRVPLSGYNVSNEARLILFSLEKAQVTITAPGYSRTVTVDPARSTTVMLTDPSPSVPKIHLDQPDFPSRNIFDVTSDKLIGVYCYFVTESGSEAYTPLPVESWGSEYTLITLGTSTVDHRAQYNEELMVSIPAPLQAIIVASEDQTEVRIAPAALTSVRQERLVQLNAGQAILIESQATNGQVYFSEDLSGAHVISNKPIGVMSGTTRNAWTKVPGTITGNTVKNAAIEWLPPTSLYGQSFVYRPLTAGDYRYSDEMIRFTAPVASSALVRPADAPAVTLLRGNFAEIPAAAQGSNGFALPMPIQTSVPMQGMLFSGTRYVINGDPTRLGTVTTSSRAMAEIFPRERWMTNARFHIPDRPSFLRHTVAIVADTGCILRLDGNLVNFDPPKAGADWRHTLMQILPGDHSLVATKGRFSAIAFGEATGLESIRPEKAKKDGDDPGSLSPGKDGDDPTLLHPTIYSQVPSLAYAYPIVGPRDSNEYIITRLEDCDSTVVNIRYSSRAWAKGAPWFAADSLTNADYEIDSLFTPDDVRSGYRIVIRPADLEKDGYLRLRLTDSTGVTRNIIYTYRSQRLDVIPDPVDLGNVSPSVQQQFNVWLRNSRSYPITVTSAALVSGFRGFRLKSGTRFPLTLKPGDSIPLTLFFLRVDYDETFVDQLVLAIECRNDTVPLRAHTTGAPAPVIGSHDWGDEHVIAPCSKNDTAGYLFDIDLYNSGQEDLLVESVELVGQDAADGIFTLDFSDPNTTVRKGAILQHGDTVTFRRRQRVIFRPREEKDYGAVIRLITANGDTVDGALTGSGIESHMEIGDLVFPPVDLSAPPVTPASGTVSITALPTRPLTIRDIRFLGATAPAFWLDPADSAMLPRTLAPGDIWQVKVLFLPSKPGIDSALIAVVGDHSRCDDSTGSLVGTSFVQVVRADGGELGMRLACLADSTTITLVNDGRMPVALTSVRSEPAGELSVDPLAPGIVLKPGEGLVLTVRFGPRAAGPMDAALVFETLDPSGAPGRPLSFPVRGIFAAGTIRLGMSRGARITPGESARVPITIDSVGAPYGLPLGGVTLRVRYNPRILRVIDGADVGSIFYGTLFSDWRPRAITSRPGLFEVVLDPPNPPRPLDGPGVAARLRFQSYIGDSLGSEIPVEMEVAPGGECITVESRPGRISLDTICGLSLRMIEVGTFKYALEANRPNPFSGSTEIDFSLGLDGHVRLAVMNARGEEIERLVDRDLPSGSYTASWDARRQPAGLYYYRITSGAWSRLGTMMLVK